MNLSRAVNIEDLRLMAQRRLPKSVFDYLDGGAEAELTLAENCRAFRDVLFRPRSAVAVGDCDLRTRVLGHEIAFPAILAPVGYSRLMHPEGEVAAARVAGQNGTGYILSTISGHKLENVKAASNGPVWYQLYLLGGREAAEGSIDRARRAGFSALVITVDTPVAGLRERDPRNGMKELLGTVLVRKNSIPAEHSGASGLAVIVSAGRWGAQAGKRGDPGQGPDGTPRRWSGAGQRHRDLGRSALDSRSVVGPDHREGSAHGR